MFLLVLQCSLRANAITIKTLAGAPTTMGVLQTTGALCVYMTWFRTSLQLASFQYQSTNATSTK